MADEDIAETVEETEGEYGVAALTLEDEVTDKLTGLIPGYKHTFEIAEVPASGEPTYMTIAAGIQTVTPSGNETIDQTPYYDGEGFSSSDVTGGQLTLSFSGHRKYGDAAQDFIAGLKYQYGEKRKVMFRMADLADGEVVTNKATLANIVAFGGDAPSKQTFSFEIHCNGAPTVA